MNCIVPALIILRLASIAMCKDVFFVYEISYILRRVSKLYIKRRESV